MDFLRWRYELMVVGKGILWTPLLVALIMGTAAAGIHLTDSGMLSQQQVEFLMARTLSTGGEMLLPLTAGVLMAMVADHDPALELQLTLARSYAWTVLRRLALILGWIIGIEVLWTSTVDGLGFRLMAMQLPGWFAPFVWLIEQVLWLAPLLWFTTLGFCLVLLLHSRAASVAILGGIWSVVVGFKDIFTSDSLLQHLLLFPVTLIPMTRLTTGDTASWLLNHGIWGAMALVFFAGGWLLVHQPERQLKGAEAA